MSEAPVALAPEEPLVAPAPAEAPVAPAEAETPPETTAEPAPAEAASEPPKTDDRPASTGKNHAQRAIDRATRRFYEQKARADFLEQQLAERTPKPPVEGAPKLEQFSDIEEYAKARENFAREQAVKEISARQQAQTMRQHQERLAADWEAKADKGSSKYEDFEQVVGNLQPTHPWAVAIMQADNAEEVAYYLGKNQGEARRIMALDPIAQMREVGKLEAKLALEPPKPKTPSQAPAPIAPVGGKSGGASDMPLDTDDIATWMQKENARMRKLQSGA